MSERTVATVFFDEAGAQNTKRTLEIALKRTGELRVRTILVASTTGETGVRAARLCRLAQRWGTATGRGQSRDRLS